MTVNEAAARLNITYDLCLRYLRRGTLKGRKAGRTWDVDAGSVVERLLMVADYRARAVTKSNGKGE